MVLFRCGGGSSPSSSGGMRATFLSISGGAKLNLNITGKAKRVFAMDSRGYAQANYDPSTGEITTTGVYGNANVFTNNFSYSSVNKFVLTDGNISTTAAFSGSTFSYIIVYELE